MSGSDLGTFLESVVPSALKAVSSKYVFMVVGTRAINAYLQNLQLHPMATRDWDVLLVGPEETQEAFAQAIYAAVEAKGYEPGIEYHEADGGLDADKPFALRSRPWIRLTVSLGGEADVAFLDVYMVGSWSSGLGVAIEKDGLLYSDLGFLMRELNRDETSARRLLSRAREVSARGVEGRTETLQEDLDDNGLELEVLEDETDDLAEKIGQIPDSTARKLAADQRERLEKAKKTLMRVSEDREVLFGLVASGRLNKAQVTQVCGVCRSLDSQYSRFKDLKERCEQIRRLC
jgi:hypothetical protein